MEESEKGSLRACERRILKASWFSSLQKDKILNKSKFKAFADDEIIGSKKLKFVLGRVENIVGNGENAG